MINNLTSLPISEIASFAFNRDSAEFLEFGKRYALKNKLWLYPQVLAHIGKWTPVRTSDGNYDLLATVRANAKTELDKACWTFAVSKHRFLKTQYKDDAPYYAATVPLIMAAFKKYQGISYSSWDRDTVDKFGVAENLLEAMMEDTYSHWTKEYLLEQRNKCFIPANGGAVIYGPHNIATHYQLDKGTPDKVGIKTLSKLGCHMILQTWLCHPSNRNAYMILNPRDWDDMPEPLVADSVVTSGEVPWGTQAAGVLKPKASDADVLPWNSK